MIFAPFTVQSVRETRRSVGVHRLVYEQRDVDDGRFRSALDAVANFQRFAMELPVLLRGMENPHKRTIGVLLRQAALTRV